MYSTSEYIAKKETNAAKAKAYLNHISQFESMIRHSIDNTFVYDETIPEPEDKVTDGFYPAIQVIQDDCLPVIMKTVNKYPFQHVTVLSDSNYKEPGGSFMTGGSSQEDKLCHASTLYPVLQANTLFYNRNRTRINKGLYTNRALYINDVRFEHQGDVVNCDVLSCSAPNRKVAQSYCNVTDNENTQALTDRIHFALQIAEYWGTEHLILGAFGCGWCQQSAAQVAALFNTELRSGQYHFKTVQFAIPAGQNPHYNAYLCFKSEFRC